MQKNLAILVTGQIRNSSLYLGANVEFVNSFKKNVLNKELTEKYNVSVFFCVDRIHEESLKKCCGNYLKKYIELDVENIKNPLNLQELEKNYFDYYNNRKQYPEKYNLCTSTNPRPSYVHKFYKLYCAYNLMIEYEESENMKHDYILSMRPDSIMHQNLYNYIDQVDKQKIVFATNLEYLYYGTREIMIHLCNLILIYGKYNYGEFKHKKDYTERIKHCSNYPCYYEWWKIATCWSESPEVQVVEHTLSYFYINNISYDRLLTFPEIVGLVTDRHTPVKC